MVETEESEKVINVLCYQYQKEEIEITNKASWLHENGNLEKFVKFISNSN